MTFHSLSRHYSYPDHASIHTNAEQRAVSFDNDIYDLYLSLPVEHRFDARAHRGALRYLSPKHADVPSANDGLPIASSYVKSLHQLKQWTLIALKLRKRNRKPDHHVRTWATTKWILLHEKYFMDQLVKLPESEGIQMLSWLDRDELRRHVNAFRQNNDMAHSAFFCDAMWGLINIDHFLCQIH
jgi:hypothetical protein